MTLYAVRFLCSVVAAFARLVRELRKAIAAMAASSSAMMSPIPSAPKTTAAVSPVGLIATTPLPLRNKALATAVTIPEMKLMAALAPPPQVVASDVEVEQQMDSKRRRKADWSATARRRPSRLVIPVADDAGEVAAGWGAVAVKDADVEVEGEGFWVASRAGPRHAMEDAYSVITGKNGGDSQLAFYGVFDGHGGRTAVDFVSQQLGNNVVSAVHAAERAATMGDDGASSVQAEHDAVSAAIRAAYLATDSELLAKHQGASGGACAATALVKNGADLYVAHLGDCRAVLSRDGGAAAALTADHTCAAEGERDRIERGGGYVSRSGSGVWRVQGSLAVSRSFGDCGLKRWVLAEPEVARVPLIAGCEFLVVASDGLWDKVSNQEAVDVVSRSRNAAAAAASSVGRSCAELVELARRRGSRDDVTVMVIDLERFVRSGRRS